MTPNAAIEVHARAQAIACDGIDFGKLRGAKYLASERKTHFFPACQFITTVMGDEPVSSDIGELTRKRWPSAVTSQRMRVGGDKTSAANGHRKEWLGDAGLEYR
jgi:hypothetical protein